MSEGWQGSTEELLAKAGVLSEALPFMRRYAGKTFVIKYGGGPQIGALLDRLKIKSEFVDGLRVTDRNTVDIVEMVLSGSINKSIVQAINAAGGRAVGLSGKDGGLVRARKLRRTRADPDSNIEKILDLGFVGEPTEIDAYVLETLSRSGIIPVIAPIGVGTNGETFNINADTVAGAIAGAIDATRLLMLTDVAGVLDDAGQVIADMSADEARAHIDNATISGGMIPKVETCIKAIRDGVGATVIMDGRTEHALLLEIFTDHGVGTAIWDKPPEG